MKTPDNGVAVVFYAPASTDLPASFVDTTDFNNHAHFVSTLPECWLHRIPSVYYSNSSIENVFMSSVSEGVSWFYRIGGGASINLITDYPYDDVATIVVIANAPLPVYVRIPVWATNATLYVNEEQQPTPQNGTMYKVYQIDIYP